MSYNEQVYMEFLTLAYKQLSCNIFALNFNPALDTLKILRSNGLLTRFIPSNIMSYGHRLTGIGFIGLISPGMICKVGSRISN